MMILIGLDSEDLNRCIGVCIYFSLLGLGYTSNLENGYIDDVEDRYTTELRGSEQININENYLIIIWDCGMITDLIINVYSDCIEIKD